MSGFCKVRCVERVVSPAGAIPECALCGDAVPSVALHNGLCNRCNFLVSLTKVDPSAFQLALQYLKGSRSTMRDFTAWHESLKNFDWLPKEIPGASDLDQIIHASRKGGDDSFLVFESKAAGIAVPTGQRILFEGLRRRGLDVVVVHGPHLDDDGARRYFLSGDWDGNVTKEELQERTLDWWYRAKGRRAS